MSKKTLPIILSVFVGVIGGLFSVSYSFAQSETAQDDLKSGINQQIQAGSGYSENVDPADPRQVIASIIKWALGLLGTIFLVLLLMSGYWLVIARGREDYVTKARKTALRATIGLIIVLLSYSITVLVTSALQSSTGMDGGGEREEKLDWRQL